MGYDFEKLATFIESHVEKNKIPGVSICINEGEKTIFNRGFGIKNASTNEPVDGETIFGIASMSKSITCMAICLLEHEGKLKLSDPVAKWLPSFSIPGTPQESVLIRHLEEHTAGIPPLPILEWSLGLNTPPEVQDAEYYDKLSKTAKNKMQTLEEMLEYIADGSNYRPLGAPGEQMSYSNECFALLSYIVDRASGIPFEQFVRENIFEPMRMSRTTHCHREAKSMGNITSLFSRRGKTLYCSDVWDVAPPYRGYGVFKSTSHDMANYYEMLSCGGVFRGKRIIPAEVVETMTGARYPELVEGYYCQGLTKRTFSGAIICEHTGGLKGVSSKGGYIKGRGASAVALCNVGGGEVSAMLHACYNMLLDLPLDTHHCAHTPAENQPTDFTPYLGDFYCNEEEESRYHVFVRDGFLRARYNNDDSSFKLNFCHTTFFLGAEDGNNPLDGSNWRFLVRDGSAWAVKIGSRIYQRVEER